MSKHRVDAGRLAAMLLMALSSTTLLAGPDAGETPRRPDELDLPELEFQMPTATEARLANGIRVLIFENHDLPLVTLSAYIAMGKRYLPPDRHTACRLLGRVWDEGGAGALGPEALDEAVAALGMSLGANVQRTLGYVTANMVRDDLEAGAQLWRDLLLQPGLANERLQRAKARQLKDVQGINDDVERLAATWFWRLLAGADSPEGRVPTRSEIDAVSRDDILALHAGFVRPERTVIGVAGDVTREEAVALLEGLLGTWQAQAEVPALPLEPYAWQRVSRAGVFLLPGDFEQCHLRMGRGLPDLTDVAADYPQALLLDFGVGYLRVYYRTRSEGLSYSTGSRVTADADRGEFYAMGSTRTDRIVDLVQAVREEVVGLADAPLDQDDLSTVQTFILGTRIRRMETARDVLQTYLENIAAGRTAAYTEDLIAAIQATTVEDLARVAERYVTFGDNPLTLVVGSPEGGATSLEKLGLGPVTVLDEYVFGE